MKEPWSDGELDILRKMNGAGCTLKEVARVLKARTEAAIRSKMRSEGLRVQNPEEIDYESFRKIMAQRGKVIECG